ncbi:MAG: hypothetical protein OIF57_07670 [Marinobacterium sp.]|nr:hypothetical protein [Marinobacterium sp.]
MSSLGNLPLQPDALKRFFTELAAEIWEVSWTLFKLMVPTLLVVKVLEEMGGVELLGQWLGPVMQLVGLPDSMGLVWATTMLTNIYAGMIVFFQLSLQEPMTVAQVTVLSTLLLFAHGLPVEVRIAQQAGMRVRVSLLLRIGGGLLLGWMQYQLYAAGDWLQQPNVLAWQPEPVDNSLQGWFLAQAESLVMIQLIIIVLLTGLKLLKVIGVEKLMAWLLRPLLRLLKIGSEATTITIIGATLGLAFGGGLLIKEARAGHVPEKDVFAAMAFLAMSHSLIEDTLLVLVLGADLTGVLWMRLLFTVVVVAFLTRWVARRSDPFWQRWLVNPHIRPQT